MMSIRDMSKAELAGCISEHLMTRKIEVVLSGGACVEHYSNGKYTSLDLDLVNLYFARRERITAAMSELGFSDDSKYFRHPDTQFLVEFPPGPLGVGEEPVSKIIQIKTRAGVFSALSPTDCVKDRLVQYYHWDDLQCLEQAIMVAQANDVDLKELERWSAVERKSDTFTQIKSRLS